VIPPGRSRLPALAAAAVTAVLVLAACGGGGGGGGGDAANARPGSGASGTAATGPGPSTSASAAALPAVDRTFAVGVREETYVDPSRSTSANGSFPGAPDRTLPVTLRYPATGDPNAPPTDGAPPDRSGGPYPLVLFAHGYAVTPEFYSELLDRWAAAGYVVAAPTYPILSGIPGGPAHSDYEKTFADTSFVLGELLGAMGSGAGPHPLAGMVDPERVGAAGQSDGEAIAYGVGFLQCCRDPRVKSVVAMAGVLGNINNPVQRDSGVPILHLMGEADEVQPYADAIAWDRENLTAPRWMVSLVGGTHAAPYRSPAAPHFDGVVRVTTDFLDGTLKGRPDRLTRIDAFVAENASRFRLER